MSAAMVAVSRIDLAPFRNCVASWTSVALVSLTQVPSPFGSKLASSAESRFSFASTVSRLRRWGTVLSGATVSAGVGTGSNAIVNALEATHADHHRSGTNVRVEVSN